MGKTAITFVLAFLALFSAPVVFAQDTEEGGYYWISFTDKNNTPFSLGMPEAFLSPRAISRRLQQGISLTEADLPVNPSYLDSLRTDELVQVFSASRWLNGVLIKTTNQGSLDRILSLPFVVGSELVKPIGEEVKGKSGEKNELKSGVQDLGQKAFEHSQQDAFWEARWRERFSGMDPGYSGESIAQLNGIKLLEDGFRGAGKLIAVLDAGYYAANQLSVFSHLWESGRIAGTRDFVESPENIFGSSPHGTYVLSVMGGQRPGSLMGTATEATYWLIRTEDARTEYRIEEYYWLAGAELADSVGADVINSSLGYSQFDDPEQNYTYSDLDGETTIVARAANMAFERGILVVNSAGNYGNQAWRFVGSPADSFGALGVGAVDIKGTVAGFSSRGPTADGRIKPDIVAHGLGVPVSDLSEGVGLVNGTSFSSPMIAGMSASLWGKHPNATASELKKAIIQSGHLFFRPDTIYGHGIPDFNWASRLLQYDFQPSAQLVIFPNPVLPASFLSYYSDFQQEYKIEVFDLRGQMSYLLEGQTLFPGYNRIQPFEKMGHLDNGIYFLRLVLPASGEFSVAKFVKAW